MLRGYREAASPPKQDVAPPTNRKAQTAWSPATIESLDNWLAVQIQSYVMGAAMGQKRVPQIPLSRASLTPGNYLRKRPRHLRNYFGDA